MNPPLPTVAGVGPSSQWLRPGPWKTVLDFLKEQFPKVEIDTWIMRMAKGEVIDETGHRLNPESAYRVGACIYYYREVENESSVPFVEQVLYRDEHILVADKPHFLPVIPSGKFLHETLLVRLRKTTALKTWFPFTVSIVRPREWCCFQLARKHGVTTLPFSVIVKLRKPMKRSRPRSTI